MLKNKIKKINSRKLFIIFTSIELLIYIFNFDKYMQLSGLYIPIVLALIMGIMSLKNSKFVYCQYTIDIVLLFMSILISCLIAKAGSETGYLLAYLIGVIFIFIISQINFNDMELKYLINAYIIAGCIFSLALLFFGKNYYYGINTRKTIQLFSDVFDPNYLSAFIVIPSILSFWESIQENDILKKILYGIGAIITIIGIFLTGSRGSMLAVIIGYFSIVFCLILKKGKSPNNLNLKKIIVIGLIILLIFIISIPKDTFFRFFDLSSWFDKSNSRRMELWYNAIITIKNSPILGYGCISTAKTIGNVTGFFEPAHSTFLDIYIHLGLLGVWAILSIFIKNILKNSSILAFSISISTMISFLFISGEATFDFWINIGLLIAITKKITYERKKDNGKVN